MKQWFLAALVIGLISQPFLGFSESDCNTVSFTESEDLDSTPTRNSNLPLEENEELENDFEQEDDFIAQVMMLETCFGQLTFWAEDSTPYSAPFLELLARPPRA